MLRDEEQREVNGIIYKERKVYVPKDNKLRMKIIRLHHDMPVGGYREQLSRMEIIVGTKKWSSI